MPDDDGGEADTAEEFQAHFIDAGDARARFEELAKVQDAQKRPELAALYREIGGTVISLLADVIASTGGALEALEEDVDAVQNEDGEATESVLLPKDAAEYVQYFEQVMRLLDGLDGIVPAGPSGDDQRKIFGALRRMTNDRLEFTKAITAEEAPGAPDDDADDPDDEDE